MLKLLLMLLLSANSEAKSLAYSVKLETDLSVGTAWITNSKVFGKEVLVSNAHVCVWHNDIKSLSAVGLKEITVIYMRPETDVCIMDFSYDGKKLYRVLKLSKTILIPQKVRSDGFPRGNHKITKHKTVGILGVLHPVFSVPIVSWIYSPSQPPGISGSPVLNRNDEVVGMIWGVNETLDYNLGVSLTELRAILQGEYWVGLVSQQNLFLRDVAKLIQEIHRLGFEISAGELWRSPEQQKIYFNTGKSTTLTGSKHLNRLAIDLNFFKNGKLVADKVTLEPIGRYWETLDSANKWGGFWPKFVDCPHFERNV